MLNTLVIISFYTERDIKPLLNLIKQIDEIQAGVPFDVAIVCNSQQDSSANLSLKLNNKSVKVIVQENKGFNIGAWDFGWRQFPTYDYYLFLQDDCFITRQNWLKVFVERFSSNSKLGLLGESMNWELSWEELAQSKYNGFHREHILDGEPVKRIALYRKFLALNQIAEGKNAEHLQTTVLFTSRTILEQVDGFIIGQNYGEAIASEIAISKKIQQLGYSIETVKPNSCYHYIAHPQWVKRRRKVESWLYTLRATLNPIFAQPK